MRPGPAIAVAFLVLFATLASMILNPFDGDVDVQPQELSCL